MRSLRKGRKSIVIDKLFFICVVIESQKIVEIHLKAEIILTERNRLVIVPKEPIQKILHNILLSI